MELRKRDDREEPEESTESEKKKTKRGHRKKDVAKEDEKGDENSQPIANIDDEGAAESEFKWVEVTVGFGARAEKNSNGEDVFYMNPSNGAKSETHHVTVKAKVENKDMDIKSLEPIAELALQRLKIPVVYDSKVHTIMLPDATSSYLDRAKSAPVYHMLSDIEKHWLWSGDTLTIIAVDKARTVPRPEPTPKSAFSSNKNKSDTTKIQVNLYYGGKKYQGFYLADHASGAKSASTLLTKALLDLPLTRASLTIAADEALRNSAQSSQFSDDHHVLLHETLDRRNSYPCKAGQEKLLPVCLPVEDTFIRSVTMEKGLNVLIVRRDMVEMKGSFSGGTNAEDNGAGKIDKGVQTFAAGLCMGYITHSSAPPKFMHGLTPLRPWTKEDLLGILNAFGRWAYNLNPVVTLTNATDIAAHIRNTVDHLARDQHLADTIPKGILVDGYQTVYASSSTSAASQVAGSSGAIAGSVINKATAGGTEITYFNTRLSGNAEARTTTLTLKDLVETAFDEGSLDIQLAEAAGKGRAHSAGDWLNVQSITINHPTDPLKNNTFSIVDAAGDTKRLRIKHFSRVKEKEDSEVDSAGSDEVDTDDE